MLGKVLLRDRPRLAVPTNRKTTLCEKTRSTRNVATTPTCHSREGGAEELGAAGWPLRKESLSVSRREKRLLAPGGLCD